MNYDSLKRGLDIVGATVGLVATAPVQIAVALAVWRCHGRPVLFRQIRPGRHGELFELLKFRTMVPKDAIRREDADRLTPLGQALRYTSLDELPSLVNVLRGDMSFVGPRPLLAHYLPLYSRTQARRHEVRPGITGLAQVRGRNATSWASRLATDVEYVETRSLTLDARILIETILVVLKREGIAAEGHATMSQFTGEEAAADD